MNSSSLLRTARHVSRMLLTIAVFIAMTACTVPDRGGPLAKTWVVELFEQGADGQNSHVHAASSTEHANADSVIALKKGPGNTLEVWLVTGASPGDSWRNLVFEAPTENQEVWINHHLDPKGERYCKQEKSCALAVMDRPHGGGGTGGNMQYHMVLIDWIEDHERVCEQGSHCMQIDLFCATPECDKPLDKNVETDTTAGAPAAVDTYAPIHKGTGHSHSEG